MKRLLLLIGLICAVPMVAGMSSKAHAGNQKVVSASTGNSALNGFLSSGSSAPKKIALKQDQPTDPTVPVDPTAPLFPTAPAPEAPAVVPPPSVTPQSGSASLDESQKLRMELEGISRQEFDIKCPCYGSLSPGLTIFNPAGFGADNNTLFLSGSYQSRTRFTNDSDGELGIGLGLGDARNAIGAEISYSIDSFGRSQGFGSGGFNVKLHKRLDDDLSLAIGWNRFANVIFGGGAGINLDYPKNSYYLVGTKVFATTNNVDSFLSRIALTAGVGGGQFLSDKTIQDAFNAGKDPTGVNVFGSAALRIAQPLSAVVEWTGQDLAAGLSYVPFQGFPLVISPSFRDITGAGNGSRFVLGTGLSYTF